MCLSSSFTLVRSLSLISFPDCFNLRQHGHFLSWQTANLAASKPPTASPYFKGSTSGTANGTSFAGSAKDGVNPTKRKRPAPKAGKDSLDYPEPAKKKGLLGALGID
eukprot:m.821821 g.821821  ORF g.821821 m.821821 type:complete len:107 (-) comp59396_c0_seq18:100-420(-)